MKNYTLTAIIEGETIAFDTLFKSRKAAIDYFFNYYLSHYREDFQINDEYYVNGNKHNREYVNDYSNRFRIERM